MRHAIPKKRRRHPDLRQMPRQWKWPNASRSETAHGARIERSEIRGRSRGFYRRSPGFAALNPGYKIFSDSLGIKGSRTPTDASSTAAPAGAARALQGALACRRSTVALARGTAGPQGSASGHASGDSPERSIRYGRPNRGAETLRCSTGVTRAVLSPSCEHLTCRSLCRQVDARRRPSAEGTNPLPASTTPAPASYSSPAGVLVRRAR